MGTIHVPSFPIPSITPLANPVDMTSFSDQRIVTTLLDSPHIFLKSDPSLHDAALVLAKRYLDPLAKSISEAQHLRLQSARRKRKRADGDELSSEGVLRLREIHVKGLTPEQIWEQAVRIINAGCQEVEEHQVPESLNKNVDSSRQNGTHRHVKAVHFEDAESLSDPEFDNEKFNGVELQSEDISGSREDHARDAERLLDEHDDMLDDEDLDHDGSEEDIEEDIEDEEDGLDSNNDRVREASPFIKDNEGLNDGFFSIDSFNRRTEFLEQQDAAGDPDDGAASDEEELDWGVDPLSQDFSTINGTTKKRKPKDPGEEEEDDDGPTFGDADLDAPWSESENNSDEEGDIPMDDAAENNANDIYYADFFAPPTTARSKKNRPLPKTQPPGETTLSRPESPTEEDLQRTISAVHRDIFSDGSVSNDAASNPNLFASSDSYSDSPSEPTRGPKPKKANLSSHERRQLSLADQIRRLETAAVAKRAWTLKGEARAAERPINSLLEEDLDFERVGKPVPVLTAEVSSSIEDLVKARILARQFDEVPRRRPGAEDEALAAARARRGLANVDLEAEELERREGGKGLAEVYEEEFRRKNEDGYQSVADKKVEELHKEIEGLWKNVCGKLDALSSWHYTPRPPDVEVRIVDDKPRVLMEEARPAGVGGVGVGGANGGGGVLGDGEGGLAPQEVFKVGAEKEKKGEKEEGVVTTSGGGVVGSAELTREQKVRRRRREKERMKKREGDAKMVVAKGKGKGNQEKTKIVKGKRAEEREKLLGELQRGDVKVIGKGGELTDVKGEKARVGEGRDGVSGGGLKL